MLGENNAKTLGASRTDAMVSADDFVCKITTKVQISAQELIIGLNKNLPQDIRILKISQTLKDRNIIDEAKTKTYRYYFCNEQSPNPMISPFMTNFYDHLDIELVKKAAQYFEGAHDFKRFCYKPHADKVFNRVIDSSRVIDNDQMSASFFPKTSYIFEVKAKGFMRHQVRIMMGALVLVGSNELSLEQLKESLLGENFERIPLIAPASGLKLFKTDFIL